MKKECKKARELMSLIIDKKITDEEFIWFDAHISFCDNCVREFDDMKRSLNVLKYLKHENVPPDFYFKLNKALDEVEAKRNTQKYTPIFQTSFRVGLIFAILIIGIFITLRIVKDNSKTLTSEFIKMNEKKELSEAKDIVDTVKSKKDFVVAVSNKKDIADKKDIEMRVPVMRTPVNIEYKKGIIPYNLVSAGGEDYQKALNRVYIHPMPLKSYYELNQIHIPDEFNLKAYNFVVDNRETWKKFCLKYDIKNEFGEPDFNNEMIVLTTVDENLSHNFSIEIINAFKEIDRIVVIYRINKLNEYEVMNGKIKRIDAKIIAKTQLPVIFKRIQ
ncbi:MAG: zf-HC2 domain-containing protein [Candidatus Goldbacteria bacterium]|nr:zf-HC2 domain-containing protein [Candidatus Goldiibacteriota bacterium]